MENEKVFATRIGCIDGRTHRIILNWANSVFGVDYVDMATEAGANKVMSRRFRFFLRRRRLKRNALVSKKKHNSKILILSAHHECAGNLVSMVKHHEQLRRAFERVQGWGFEIVVAVWINQNWEVDVIAATKNAYPALRASVQLFP